MDVSQKDKKDANVRANESKMSLGRNIDVQGTE